MQAQATREKNVEFPIKSLIESEGKEKATTAIDSQETVNGELERRIFGNHIAPYEKKYFALLQRCELVKQSNEKLINRIYYVKKLLRRRKKERKFLIDRLDGYGDDYRSAAESIYAEMMCDNTPPQTPQRNNKSDNLLSGSQLQRDGEA